MKPTNDSTGEKESFLEAEEDPASPKHGSPRLGSPRRAGTPSKTDSVRKKVADVSSSALFKIAVLSVIVFQRSSWFVAAHYSRSIKKEEYSSNSLVMTSEMLKLLFSALGMAFLDGGPSDLRKPGQNKMSACEQWMYLIQHSRNLAVIAGLYFLQNALSYIAVGYLTGPLYVVMNQLKVLTAAVFSVLILGRKLSGAHWRALLLLVLAEVLINEHDLTSTEAVPESYSRLVFGLIITSVQVSCSGLAGVLFEKSMKTRTDLNVELNVYDRNLQLAFWSIISGIIWNIGSYLVFPPEDPTLGFYSGWTLWAVFLVLNTACGGIWMGFVFKYTNAIIKSFSVTVSIITSSIALWLWFGEELSFVFIIGTTVCIIALSNYTLAPKPD